MIPSLSVLTRRFVVYPVSKGAEEFVGCLCPKCKELYVVGYFYLYDELRDDEVEHDIGFYISSETVTCINCGQGDLPRPLVFLTSEEAANYVIEHDSATFFKVGDNQCEMWIMNTQAYLDLQKKYIFQ